MSLEEFRVRIKKLVVTSWPGIFYNNALLVISIASSIEFIYQTYLDPINDAKLLNDLNYIEKGLASLFIFDWCLNFFMADHKIKFMTRFVLNIYIQIIAVALKYFLPASSPW